MRSLAESRALARVGNWEFELDSRRLTWSDEMYDLYGVSPATFTPTRDALYGLLSPDDAEVLRRHLYEAERTGQGWENDIRMTLADGQERILQGRARVEWDDGKPVRVRGTRQDVTELRARETELHLAEERFRLAFDEAPIGVALVATDGRWLRVNRALGDIVGYPPEEMLRLSFQDITHPDDVAADLVYIRKLLAGEIPSNQVEKRYIHADGHPVWVQLNVSLAHDEAGIPLYFITQVQDITERKQGEAIVLGALQRERELTERLRELDRIKSDFVATVSHELRTPLTNIIGSIEVLADGDFGELTPQQGRVVDVMERNSRRLLELIKDLLDLNQIESEGLGIRLASTELRPLVDGVRSQVAGVAEARNVTMVFELDDELGSAVVDGHQLVRVLENLLTNAVKFSPEGETVTVRVERTGSHVVVVVADHGIGIPAEEQERLFTRFFRSSAATENAIPGTGLGLVIVKSIVEDHGGTISVDSTLGEGTAVTVSIPLEPPPEPAVSLAHATA